MAKERDRDTTDEYDRDLERDSRREPRGHTMEELAQPGDEPGADLSQRHTRADVEHRQHARTGQAESPVEDTLNQPPKKKEGHR